MDPYELYSADGVISYGERASQPSIERLAFIAKTFEHSVWLNPRSKEHWPYTETTVAIAKIFPMFELSLEGIEGAVGLL